MIYCDRYGKQSEVKWSIEICDEGSCTAIRDIKKKVFKVQQEEGRNIENW